MSIRVARVLCYGGHTAGSELERAAAGSAAPLDEAHWHAALQPATLAQTGAPVQWSWVADSMLSLQCYKQCGTWKNPNCPPLTAPLREGGTCKPLLVALMRVAELTKAWTHQWVCVKGSERAERWNTTEFATPHLALLRNIRLPGTNGVGEEM